MAKSEIRGLLVKCSSGRCGKCESCRPDLVKHYKQNLTPRDRRDNLMARLLVQLKTYNR